MSKRDLIVRELADLPEQDVDTLLGDVRSLKQSRVDLHLGILAAENSLAKDWAHARRGCSLGRFVRGDVVVLNFPFRALRQAKRRPALVLADLPGSEVILCQTTSKTGRSPSLVTLKGADSTGSLNPSKRIRRHTDLRQTSRSLRTAWDMFRSQVGPSIKTADITILMDA